MGPANTYPQYQQCQGLSDNKYKTAKEREEEAKKAKQEKKHKETCAKKRALRKNKNKVKKNQFAVYNK